MKDAGRGAQPTGPKDTPEILKAKYFDYCSAQLADLLLYLSPDEIYLIARRADQDSGEERSYTYEQTVRLATEWLSGKVVLPPFEVWAEDYQANPERYEEYLMGLWESEVERPDA